MRAITRKEDVFVKRTFKQIVHDLIEDGIYAYAMNLADAMEKAGMDMSELKLESGVFGAEPWSEKMREQLEKRLHIRAQDIYGLTEMKLTSSLCRILQRSDRHQIQFLFFYFQFS